MASQRSVVLLLEVQNQKARKAIQATGTEFKKLNKATSRTTAAMGTGFNRGANAISKTKQPIEGTTTAVTNFNRVIQDAPFGIIGVANNLEPMVQSFNKLKSQTGTTTGALRTLITSALTGPGALITAVSVGGALLTGLTLFGDRLFGAGEGAEEAKEHLEAFTGAAKDLRDILSTDFGLADQLDRDVERTQQAIELARQREQLEDDISGLVRANLQSSNTARLDEIDAKREAVEAANQLINVLGFENTELEALESNLKSLETQQDLFNGTVGTAETKLAAFVDSLEGDVNEAILRFETGVDDTTESVDQQAERIENLISSFLILAQQGDATVIPAIKRLQKALEDLNKARQGKQAPTTPSVEAERPGESEILEDPLTGELLESGMDLGERIFPEGSLGALRNRLGELRKSLEMATDPETIAGLNDAIGQTQDEMKNLQGGAKVTGDELVEQMGQAAAMQILLADNAEEAAARVIDTILAQITAIAIKKALESLPFPANIAAAAGAALAARGLKELIPSFRHGVDDFGGGLARVHQGEMLTFLPEGANVITNQNVERLAAMREESRQGAANLMGMRGGGIDPDVIERAIINGLGKAHVNLSINPLDEGLGDFSQLKKRVGNG